MFELVSSKNLLVYGQELKIQLFTDNNLKQLILSSGTDVCSKMVLYFDNDSFLKSISDMLTNVIVKVTNGEDITFEQLTSSNITFKIEPDNICKLTLEVGSADFKSSFVMLFDSIEKLQDINGLADLFNS